MRLRVIKNVLTPDRPVLLDLCEDTMTTEAITALTIPTEYRTLIEEAVRVWSPGSGLVVKKNLIGGKSTASVLLVDIGSQDAADRKTATPQSLSGEFVLKLDQQRSWSQPEPEESKRHEAAIAWNPSFAAEHIPRLLHCTTHDQQIALLYEIAGQSLASLVTADGIDGGALGQRCSQLASELLEEWNQNYKCEHVSARDTLERWLGYRLDSQKAPELHRFVAESTGGREIFFTAGRLLTNPLWFCNAPVVRGDDFHARFIGMLHGDLHPGNLLLERHDPRSEQYWLIDFALSRSGPLGYDHAYFELALLLHHLQGMDPERMLGILDASDSPDGSPNADRVPVQDLGLVRCVRAMRSATDKWQKRKEPHRHDAVLAQRLLANVAAALNWANKPLAISERLSALAYGAWSAHRYLQTFHEDNLKQMSDKANQLQAPPVAAGQTAVSAPQPSWDLVWEALSKFDATASKYVLVAGRCGATDDLSSLGLLPWSAVIDLDPNSDGDGLYHFTSPVLEKVRSVKTFGRDALAVDFDRGTAWLMAGGWPSHYEDVSESQRDWRRLYLPRIRDLATNLRRAVAPQCVRVLVLPGVAEAADQVTRVLEALDEGLGDLISITVVGSDAEIDTELGAACFSLSVQDFVAGLRRMYGARDDVREPQVPGADGPKSIPIDRLRNLEEDLDVLHSEILSEESTRQEAVEKDDFWRGTQPTWADIHAGADIPRSVLPQLIEDLEIALGESRNQTIELHHSPGAGGTTLAFRAAWALREKFPTAVLRRASKYTLDRLDQLFQLSQKPVLLVADASLLPPSAREELYRGFVSRNCRVVILYVIRTTQTDKERPLSVFDPMDPNEAELFYKHYSRLTNIPIRQKSLKLITTSSDPLWKRYRSPFFYGLFTYEREYQSVERFVEAHVQGVSYRARKVMLYLALLSRYSQVGLDEGVLLTLLGLQPNSKLDLEEALGSAPARLVLKQGRQRKLLHPLLAEEVLRELLGGHDGDGWKDGLKDLAVDFIQDMVRIIGSDADEANRLFVQLFILRDVWYERQAQGRPKFSELIKAIPSAAGQHQVLQLLTELCPQEAHYWNHLGRHHYYEMRQDFTQAEEYLEKAIELSPEDSYHHHSLGMVRRFWIEERIGELFKAETIPTPNDLLAEVEDLFHTAAESFARTRELNTEDDHGYITHTQMILHVVERLVRASGQNGIVTACSGRDKVSEWLRQNLVVAEDLLTRLRHLRGQAQPSRYELTCVGQLSDIYGDFEQVIGNWEAMISKGLGEVDLRRALASAYYARKNRVWRSLSEEETRRVVDLMETNLREDPSSNRDVRMWFQAYRRLPEYSHLQALDRLEAWASRSNSLDAYYYLYVLHYLRLRDGTARGENLVLSNLEKCRELSRGRRSHSYDWLAVEPDWCPLVHHSELGKWDKAIEFYPDTSLLDEVTGTIETIKGPQSGTIKLGRAIRAFFVPSKNQSESKDINEKVHFFLGFSYDGFRAWSVRREADGRRPADGGLSERITAFVREQIARAERENRPLFVSKLGYLLSKKFPGEPIYKRLGHTRLTNYLRTLKGIVIDGGGSSEVVRRASATARSQET